MRSIRQVLYMTILLLMGSHAHAANICVPDNSPGGCSSAEATIELAVANSASGDTITLAAGNFNTAAQVVINKNLTLTGAGAASSIITLSFDTVNSGNARGWFLVGAGAVFNVNSVAFDGTGQLVYQGIRYNGSGSVDNVAFSNVKFNESGPTYQGMAIAAAGDGITNVTNSSFNEIGRIGAIFFGPGVNGSIFNNNTYMGKGLGNFLDYALEVGGGAQIDARNNRFENNLGVASDGSGSGAVLVSTFGGAGTALNLVSNTIVNSTGGVFVGYDSADTSAVTAYCNVIIGNAFGIGSSALTANIDARENWWGCNAGPNNTGCDTTAGPGAAAVDFTEWLVLSLTPGQTTMNVGDPATTLTADLTGDSGGGSSTGAPFNCTIPDGTQMTFDGGLLGTVTPVTVGTVDGVAVSSFTPVSTGTADDISVVTAAGGETVATEIIISAASADVALTKTLDTLGPFVNGQSIQYTLVASNSGPSTATNIQVTDTPTNLTITSVSSTNCSAFPCTIPSLANGASETVTVAATIDASGAFDNSATATADEADPDASNNTDNTDNGGIAGGSVDMAVVKTLTSTGPYVAGDTVTYSITATNNGPDDATNVQVTDTPTNLTITSVSSTNCAAFPCTIPSLVNGASEAITVTATIDSSGAFNNSATVSAAETDPDASNNTDDTGNGGTAGTSADVAITKTLNTVGPFSPNQSIQYTLVVTNNGPDTANNVVVTDTPSNLTITSVSSTNCSVFPCTIPSLANGSSETITVLTTINGAGSFDNASSVSADETDPAASNNADNTGNGGTASAQAAHQVPGSSWLSLLLLASLMTLIMYRRRTA